MKDILSSPLYWDTITFPIKCGLQDTDFNFLRFLKGAFQKKNLFAILQQNTAIFLRHAWSNMDSPVQVDVPKRAGYFSQALIIIYKP